MFSAIMFVDTAVFVKQAILESTSLNIWRWV